MFLRPDTLEGEKLKIYVILKFLKFVSGADVTSFKVIITIPLISAHLHDNVIPRSSGRWMKSLSTLMLTRWAGTGRRLPVCWSTAVSGTGSWG